MQLLVACIITLMKTTLAQSNYVDLMRSPYTFGRLRAYRKAYMPYRMFWPIRSPNSSMESNTRSEKL